MRLAAEEERLKMEQRIREEAALAESKAKADAAEAERKRAETERETAKLRAEKRIMITTTPVLFLSLISTR